MSSCVLLLILKALLYLESNPRWWW